MKVAESDLLLYITKKNLGFPYVLLSFYIFDITSESPHYRPPQLHPSRFR